MLKSARPHPRPPPKVQSNFYQAGCWNSFAAEKGPRHVMLLKAHSRLITMALDHFLTFCWPAERSAGPTLSHAHTAPASSSFSCSSAAPGFPCSSRSHTEWVEPPEECGHKRRNVILLIANPPAPSPNQRTCAQVRAFLNAGGTKILSMLLLA